MSHDLLLLFVVCFGILTSLVNAKTDSQDVSALNNMFTSLNSPSKLKGWKSSGGDPCGDLWEGITCKDSHVSEIKLSGKDLSGSLGYQLSNLKSVTNFDFSKNNLNGNLPYQLPPNLVYLDLSENNLNGNVPFSISQMEKLNYLNIGHNQLNGELSDMFQRLQKLKTLDLSHNQLSGKLPKSFEKLTSLQKLHLQDNQLTGSINVLTDLPLDDLNVANNKFSGWIPNELKGIDNIETGGNDWSSGRAPPPPPGVHHKAHKKSDDSTDNGGLTKNVMTGVMIAAVVLGTSLVLGCIVGFIARRPFKPSSQFLDEEKGGSQNSRPPLFTPEPSQKLQLDPANSFKGQKTVDSDAAIDMMIPPLPRVHSILKKSPSAYSKSSDNSGFALCPIPKPTPTPRPLETFSLTDLQVATASFAPARFLGAGSIGRVHRAKYADGRILAVKEIESSLFQGTNHEEFSSTVNKISKIHHPNIAELVGYCSENGHNMLVYEYFRSGSLHEFLHLSDSFSKPLTWTTRIRIALGTARAIEYLHDICSPSLVHKNIKSSNILLDAELIPHLSDSGLAHFHHHTSQNLGVGYNAPECTTPSAYTLKSDVYSFGVVMLELLTGRKPYDSDRPKLEQALVRWATPQLHDMEALAKMVDPALCGLYTPESVSRFADIISLCVQVEPEFRPPVSEVVESLVRLVQRSNMDLKKDLSLLDG